MQPHRLFRTAGILWAAFFVLSASAASGPDAETAIRAQLSKQVGDWNSGNIPAFVEAYADDCTFVGKQILQGKGSLLARYQRTYPTPRAMGKLQFVDVQVRQLDADVAVVTGQWHLERGDATKNPGGLFSLVWRRDHGVWRIALDHTS